jgi:hypothetical protein
MTNDLASLDRLQDIMTPPPVPWWPPAPGWYVLGVVIFILVALGLAIWLHRYRANAYRREALRELDVLEEKQQWRKLSVLLKRVALTAFPRTEVASLTGDSWIAWLNQHGGGTEVSTEVARILTQNVYHPTPETTHAERDWRNAAASVRNWIQTHSRNAGR